MEFLNRQTEIELISNELKHSQSRFMVLYGRRRIGKSALLQHVLGQDSVYYLADLNEAEIQRSFFAAQIAAFIPGFDAVRYPDWNTFFMLLNQQLRSRITICIDEFPNLVRSSPELASVLQKIMDLNLNSSFHLILCGSSQQMMQGIVLDKSSPLFGRVHRIIKLTPLDCGRLGQALRLDPVSAVEEYSVWGGVPRYWELRSEYAGLREAIRSLILEPYGVLHEEPLRLFLEDLRNAVQPLSIASLIGQGCNKLSEIAGRLNKPATNLNRALQVLLDTGYVKRDVCWGKSERNSKKTLYRLLDPLSRFFFTFVVPWQSLLHSGHIEQVEREMDSRWQRYVSETWEELCRDSVTRLSYEGYRFLPAKRWWQQSKSTGSTDIDIIAESTDGKALLVGEAKWGFKCKPDSVQMELAQKLEALNLKKGYQRVFRVIMLPDAKESSSGDTLIINALKIASLDQ